MSRGRHSDFGLSADELKKNPPKIDKDLLKRVFQYLLPHWKLLIFIFCTIMISAVLDLLPSILTGKIIDDGLIGQNFDLLLILIVGSFAVLVTSSLIGLLQSYLNSLMTQRISLKMRNQMYEHLQKMSQSFFTSNKQGDIITRMTSDISGVENVISSTLVSTISNIAVLVTSLFAMFQKSWVLALVGMLIIPLFVLPTKSVGKRRWSLALVSQKKNDEMNQILNETLSVSGQQLVKLFTNEEMELEKYKKVNEEIYKLKIKEGMVGRWFRMAITTFTNMGPMLIYLTGGILILKMNVTSLSVGDVTVMVALLNRMYRPVNQLLEVQIDFVRGMALFSRIFSYLDMEVEIKNDENAIVLNPMLGHIKFDHVDFGYNADTPILKNVDFEIESGKMIALVGPSGAGKSTIISLLTRLYETQNGSVAIDGINVNKLDLKMLRQNVGVVTQDSYLFNGTIKDNLLYAKPNADDQELIEACKSANIHDFINSLPDGYNTQVGNRGMKLSGGERQRISLARVILKNPSILIMDEATSSLDSISENLIQEAIEPLLKGRTSIVIAHRLSTVVSADEILVIDQGQIKEKGNHNTLLKQNGIYTELYNTQFKKILELQN